MDHADGKVWSALISQSRPPDMWSLIVSQSQGVKWWSWRDRTYLIARCDQQWSAKVAHLTSDHWSSCGVKIKRPRWMVDDEVGFRSRVFITSVGMMEKDVWSALIIKSQGVRSNDDEDSPSWGEREHIWAEMCEWWIMQTRTCDQQWSAKLIHLTCDHWSSCGVKIERPQWWRWYQVNSCRKDGTKRCVICTDHPKPRYDRPLEWKSNIT